ncbi:MAG TPA: PEP/pyruvate-binding domain-containing protein [Bacteroidales bacterium]|nr:PEP/pyruvate-binding domain-containing protein [Bacteroidales bacterium]
MLNQNLITKKSPLYSRKYVYSETPFNTLMKKRIYHVLLIASKYDAFILEDDGRIDEQIFNEYVSLNLRYPPEFIQANDNVEAIELLETESIDLVICMTSTYEDQLIWEIKKRKPLVPVVLLTPFSREISIQLHSGKIKGVDYVFSWLGNADILLAIIKLIEDSMNVEHDVMQVGVQVILLVEDSVRFYSSYLPNIYKIIFKQSKSFVTEGLNEHQKMLRMRGRPKILLATTYEKADELFHKYKNNLLGVITDMTYQRGGVHDKEAGLHFCRMIKAEDKYMPILLQSSDIGVKQIAKKLRVGYLNKNSPTLSIQLRDFISEYFAFGDFVFVDPETNQEVQRAKDLKHLQEVLFDVPDNSFLYHISRNHISKWLRARALFPLADLFKQFQPEDFANLDEIRRYLYDAISKFRMYKGRGVIAEFHRDHFDEYQTFTRIGEGSIGGKARGLAFLDSLIKRNHLIDFYDNIIITIPRTVVLGTDVFDEFMEENRLYEIALSGKPDQEILEKFVKSRLPFRIHEDLYTFISITRNPIAIRSSSLLEDSHYQPFAGIYSTYMIPNIVDDERLMIEKLSMAIKSVYASAFYRDSKAYMTATLNVIDEEKMGIVLQEVCGSQYGSRFYPTISGVARSVNFYPIEPEQPEDGIVNVAFGLGKYIVEGGNTLRFSPKYPKKLLQLASPQMALSDTQPTFYALDLRPESFVASTDDAVNLLNLKISEAEKDNSLRWVASTYDYNANMIRDGVNYPGKKIITFANILKNNVFPLAQILQQLLEIGSREMNKGIEIEFAVDLNVQKDQPVIFYPLQIRPIVETKEVLGEDLEHIPVEKTIIKANHALGNGIIDSIHDFVFVKPESFDPSKTNQIAQMVAQVNDKFLEAGTNYILVGPGRWGSTDPWLGIPVKWPQISAARLIVESGLKNYRIDPSQGTHFFQNLTSFRVGYFTINPFINDGHFDLDYLENFSPCFENEFIKHIHFEKPIVVKIDGKKKMGVVMKMD